ncbi:MAG: NAD(P)H-dependent oxidoreductase [Candidatus Saccharibacteria bacterium]
MNVLVVLGHPRKGSLNHAIAEVVIATLKDNGHEVVFHDLYAERFDPVITAEEIPHNGRISAVIQEHCRQLANADGIVIVHPNWWGQPPAILKGWVDRVFRPGVAYAFKEEDNGEGVPDGLLKIRTAVVFNTSDTPRERELIVFRDPLEHIWRNCIFGFCEISIFYRKMYSVVATSTLDERLAWLTDVREAVERYFPANT